MIRRPRSVPVPALAALFATAFLLLFGGSALAQSRGDYQLGLGLGIVEPDDLDTETYYSVAFRIPVGHHGPGDPVWDGDSYRGRPPVRTGLRTYLEPEVAAWSRSDAIDEADDLLLGLNFIGVVPGRVTDFFFGIGAGVHLHEAKFVQNEFTFEEDSERIGGNVQLGLDVKLSPNLALFGVGRLDLLEGDRFDRQRKFYGGLRIRF